MQTAQDRKKIVAFQFTEQNIINPIHYNKFTGQKQEPYDYHEWQS